MASTSRCLAANDFIAAFSCHGEYISIFHRFEREFHERLFVIVRAQESYYVYVSLCIGIGEEETKIKRQCNIKGRCQREKGK